MVEQDQSSVALPNLLLRGIVCYLERLIVRPGRAIALQRECSPSSCRSRCRLLCLVELYKC